MTLRDQPLSVRNIFSRIDWGILLICVMSGARAKIFAAFAGVASLTSLDGAVAQPFPDPRQRVEVRYDRPETSSGANFIRVRDSQCRENVADPAADAGLRRRIVEIAAREWEAFHFPTLDIASEGLTLVPKVQTRASGAAGRAIVPDAINPPTRATLSRALRLGLVEDDGEVIARIGGYWATVPGQGATATQNVIWGRGGWPGAGWAQPWSSAFVAWVMCEAGLTRQQFMRASAHASYLDAIFSAPEGSAFFPADLHTRLSPGDMVCAGRSDSKDIATIDEARIAAAQGALMHCDIVVGVMRDRILLIGGNVMNAIALTIAPSQSTGRIRSTAQRPWFGVLKLKAPDDARAGLPYAAWECLGKSPDVVACLQSR